MYIAYILDSKTLKTKDILEYSEYDFSEDINYSNKSTITAARKPAIEDNDFVICKDGNSIAFQGLCESYSSSKNDAEYTITLIQKENFFDRSIFVSSEELISTVGIEDFIVKCITENWLDTGDELMNAKSITVVAATHTKVNAAVSTTVDVQENVFNLKTYLGNVKQYYGIYLDYEFENGKLRIVVNQKDAATLPVDIQVSDITDYTEVYDINVLAKLNVKWKIPDTEENGTTITGAVTDRKFYLKTDKTITEDGSDPDRAAGIVRNKWIETESEDEMIQQVRNEFTSNSYNHKISFSLIRTSKLYSESDFYVGRKCTIKTKTGIRASIITQAQVSSSSALKDIVFGNLKVTLIEKLRRT
jgi:hypothetical protein